MDTRRNRSLILAHGTIEDQRIAVPCAISMALAFMPRCDNDREYRTLAKKTIRKVIAEKGLTALQPGGGLVEKYDARIWSLIREVLAEN